MLITLAPTLVTMLLAACAASEGQLAPTPPTDPGLSRTLTGTWHMQPKQPDALVPNIVFVLDPDGTLDFERDDSGGTNFTLHYGGSWTASSPAPDTAVITFTYLTVEPKRTCFPLPGGCEDHEVPFHESWTFSSLGPDRMETPGAVWHREAPTPAAAVGAAAPDQAGSDSPAPESAMAPAPAAKAAAAASTAAPLATPIPSAAAGSASDRQPARARYTRTLPPGSFAIHLHSMPTPERASADWDRMAKQYPELDGLTLLDPWEIQVAGRGTMYTIDAGIFPNRADAQAVCDSMHAAQQTCSVLAP
jgi:hypothetical protein